MTEGVALFARFRKRQFSFSIGQKNKAGICVIANARPEDQPISPAAMRNFLPSGSV